PSAPPNAQVSGHVRTWEEEQGMATGHSLDGFRASLDLRPPRSRAISTSHGGTDTTHIPRNAVEGSRDRRARPASPPASLPPERDRCLIRATRRRGPQPSAARKRSVTRGRPRTVLGTVGEIAVNDITGVASGHVPRP